MAADSIIVFSDIHSNVDAFEAVLNDLRNVRFSWLICLGDIVGYAANPKQCLDLARSLDCEVLKGNHDFAVADNPTMLEMSAAAARSIIFARKLLSPREAEFLTTLPMTTERGECQFVHSSLHKPNEWTYLMRESEIREHFSAQTHPIAFCGHTHIPAVVSLKPSGEVALLGMQGQIQLPSDGKVLINVGSVGQPRDRNPQACYVMFDPSSRTVEFRRVAYDIAAAQQKIAAAELPTVTGARLALGK